MADDTNLMHCEVIAPVDDCVNADGRSTVSDHYDVPVMHQVHIFLYMFSLVSDTPSELGEFYSKQDPQSCCVQTLPLKQPCLSYGSNSTDRWSS